MTTTAEPTAPSISDIATRVEPYRVADETFVLGQMYLPPGAPVGVHINSMIIRGAEPVIVDTTGALAREMWLNDALSIVDPADVRWVFLSHEEPDHEGNLLEVLDLCPNATLVTSWFAVERLIMDHALPMHRMRWVNDGESFDVGDRRLHAVRPPVFDGPATRGLFDEKTGVYWGVDSFGTPVVQPETDAADIPFEQWSSGFVQFAGLVSPWLELADAQRYDAYVAKVQALQPSVVANCHGPAVSGERLETAWSLLRGLPGRELDPLPTQADLDAALGQLGIA